MAIAPFSFLFSFLALSFYLISRFPRIRGGRTRGSLRRGERKGKEDVGRVVRFEGGKGMKFDFGMANNGG